MKGERLREKRRGIIISRDEDAEGRRSSSMEKSRRSFSLVFFATRVYVLCCCRVMKRYIFRRLSGLFVIIRFPNLFREMYVRARIANDVLSCIGYPLLFAEYIKVYTLLCVLQYYK